MYFVNKRSVEYLIIPFCVVVLWSHFRRCFFFYVMVISSSAAISTYKYVCRGTLELGSAEYIV